MAISLACGVPFMGHDVVQTCRVLYVQLEDPLGMTLERFRTVLTPHRQAAGLEELPGEENIHVQEFGNFNLKDTESVNKLYDYVEQNDIGYVIIDPLVVAADTQNYMGTVGNDLKESVRNIRDKFGCGFLFVHHVAKKSANKEEIGQEDLWGAVFVSASFEVKIMMKPLLPDEQGRLRTRIHRRYKHTKSDYTDIMLTLDINSNRGEEHYLWKLEDYDDGVPELSHNVIRKKILKELQDSDMPLSSNDLIERTGEGKSKVYYHLRVLRDSGIVELDGREYKLVEGRKEVTVFFHEEDFDEEDFDPIKNIDDDF
jgi:RecA-family ATPase